MPRSVGSKRAARKFASPHSREPNWAGDDDALAKRGFLNDLSRCHPLPAEKQLELVWRAKAGDVEARQRLISSNLPFIFTQAFYYANQGLTVLELVSEGAIGMNRAIDMFQGNQGANFITYALYWVRQQMSRELQNKQRLIRVPIFKIREVIAARKLNPVVPLPKDWPRCVSIDQPDLEGRFSLIETIPSTDEASRNPELVARAIIASEQRLRQLEQSWRRLRNIKLNQRQVLVRLHGLGGDEPRQQAQIAKELGVTRERVRQIELRLLRMLWPTKTVSESRMGLKNVHLAGATYLELTGQSWPYLWP